MAARASGGIFTARAPSTEIAFPDSPPARACGCDLSGAAGGGPLLFPLTGAHESAAASIDQPHVEVRLAGLSAGQPRQRSLHRIHALTHGWHFRTRHPPATPRGCLLCSWRSWGSGIVGFVTTQLYRRITRRPRAPSSLSWRQVEWRYLGSSSILSPGGRYFEGAPPHFAPPREAIKKTF